MNRPIRVYVLTGFLGSGKTTLLNAPLRHPDTPPIAVVVNEYGAVGLDHLLLQGAAGAPVLLENGCICCSVRSDLADALGGLLLARAIGTLPPFETIVVETTGLADPGPVLRTLCNDPALAGEMVLGGILTLVDAAVGVETLRQHPIATAQVAVADRLLISKADLADPAQVIATIRAINPAAPIDIVGANGIEPALLFKRRGSSNIA